MVICVMARRIWTHGVGGMESHTRLLARELGRRGHVVHVVTTAIASPPREAECSGVRIHHLPGMPIGDYSPQWWRASRAWAEQHFDGLGIEAVLSVSRAARGVAGMARRPPLFVVCHGYGWSQLRGFWHERAGATKLVRFLADVHWVVQDVRAWQAILAGAERVFVGSRDLCARLPSSRVTYLPNMVDVAAFRPDPPARTATRRALGIEADDVVVLMVGTVNRQKGVLDGLRACAAAAGRHPRLRAVVIGDGPGLESLRAWAREAGGLRVVFPGAREHAALPPYYAAADLFVFPSRRHEVLPLSVLEAMASSLPVVATRAGGTAEAVRHGETGYLVEVGDTGALAAAIADLGGDGERRARLGTAARRRVEAEFDVRPVVDRLVALLDKGRR